MKLIKFFVCILAATGFAMGIDGWETDIREAQRKATREKKELLIAYKAEDWEPYKVGNPERLLSNPDFMAAVRNDYITVELPYPKDSIKEDTKTTLVISDHKGRPYYVLVSFDNGRDAVMADIKYAKRQAGQFAALIDKIEQAQGSKKYEYAGELYDLIPIKLFDMYPEYKRLKESDQDNSGKFTERLEKKQSKFLKLYDYLQGKGLGGVLTGEPLDEQQKQVRKEFIANNDMVQQGIPPRMRQTVLMMMVSAEIADNFHNYGTVHKMLADCDTAYAKIEAIDPESREAIICWPCLRQALIAVYSTEDIVAAMNRDRKEGLRVLETYLSEFKSVNWLNQLFTFMKGKLVLENGSLDDGIRLLEEARDMAPWTLNAVSCQDLVSRVQENKEKILQYQREIKDGDTTHESELKSLLTTRMNLKLSIPFSLS